MQESISNLIIRLSLGLVVIGLFTTCQDEEITSRDYPRLFTHEVTQINPSGAVFTAEIHSGDLGQITEYGFVWDRNVKPQIMHHDKQIITSPLTKPTFGATAHAAMKSGVFYFVRAYVKTDKYVVYGNAVSFKSLGSNSPVITGFTPKTGNWRDTIQITGIHFRYMPGGTEVMLGDIRATVLASTDTTIRIVVPPVNNTDKVNLRVTMEGMTAISADQFAYNFPVIADFSPRSGTTGNTITITGKNFRTTISNIEVKIGNVTASVVSCTDTSIQVMIPAGVNPGTNELSVTVEGNTSVSTLPFTYLVP